MQKITRYFRFLLFLAILIGILVVVAKNYEFIFRKTVMGQITGIDRITQQAAILGSRAATDEALFSFAVALKDTKGEFFTSSSEDRQWAVVKQGDCAEVFLYPYAPWDLNSAGTFHNARLKKLLNCKDIGIEAGPATGASTGAATGAQPPAAAAGVGAGATDAEPETAP